MSDAVMQHLAEQWSCSTVEVAMRIRQRLVQAGVIRDEPSELRVGAEARAQDAAADPTHITNYFVLGITPDGCVAVLDDHDQPILWV